MATLEGARSGSGDLKLRELLKEIQIDYTPQDASTMDEVLSSIREAINKIPDDLHVTADVAPGFVRDVGADKAEFKFQKPVSVEIAGSYSFQCVARPDVNVDVFLKLPKGCFHEKDYLNHRYHAKRFLYLCIIKKYLKFSSSVKDVRWLAFHNEARKPILVVYPGKRLSDGTEFCVKIIPTASSIFPISKLNFGRNNVRAVNEGVSKATPKYNSSILEDMLIEDGSEIIKRTFFGCRELTEALVLLKVWCRKNLLYAHDCVNGFLITLILAYLASKSGKNRISASMNPMQIVRITLDFIANSKAWNSGIFFEPEGGSRISPVDRKAHLQLFPVVICGSLPGYNIAFRMSLNGFHELRDAATMALNCMTKCKDLGFDEMFMTKIDFPAKYDYCVRLNLKGRNDFCASGFCNDDESWRSYEQKIQCIIDQALRGRTNLIRVTWRNTYPCYNFENGFMLLDEEPLFIGITIGSLEEALKQAVMGPSPEDKDKASEFRRFWGDKASLRWFRDGRIAEVAVWEHEEWEKHLIVKEIIEHVLVRHLCLPRQNIVPVVDQLDFVLNNGRRDPISNSNTLLKAYDELSKRLRLIDDIPLKISSVQPLDSAFRLTSVFPPVPNPLAHQQSNVKTLKKAPSCMQPMEVMIQLEGSGLWPLNDLAIEKTKSAFLLKIAESFHSKWGVAFSASEEDVDIFISGYAFRLKILHARSLNLVKSQGTAQMKHVPPSDRKLFLRGQHSSMLNGLRGCYPMLGPVVRLAKRWVAAHLFSTILAEEAIELLVAHLFLKPLPFHSPCSRITGFLRFLRLLSEYDWSFSPLIVDINGDFTPADDNEINERFMLSRKEFGDNIPDLKPAMYLATTYDKVSDAWTRDSPTASDLKRLAAYATSSANFLTDVIMRNQTDSFTWERLFRTPLNNYDAVVLLHREKLAHPECLLFPSDVKQGKRIIKGKPSKKFQPFILRGDVVENPEEMTSKLMVGFDPQRCYVRDIEREFSETLKVWYDSYGGDAIGLTTGITNTRKRGRDCDGNPVDLLSTLKAVAELGKGLVASVHLLKVPKLER